MCSWHRSSSAPDWRHRRYTWHSGHKGHRGHIHTACAVVLALVWLIVGVPAAAVAQPAAAGRPQATGETRATLATQATREDVLGALKVDQVDADYVILVDTSSSMQAGQLYTSVAAALRPLLVSLSARDHVSLITFDSTPALRFSGELGAAADRALGQLPASATGQSTDIGAAIDAGLRELERPDARQIGTLILLTDGAHQPPPGSAYPATSGPAWDGLVARAAALNGRSNINSFALALRPETDASLLKQVFPQTSVVALPTDQVPGYFERLKEQVRVLKARALLADDVPTLQVSWNGPLDSLPYGTGRAEASVTIRSQTRHLPLTVSSLMVSSKQIDVSVAGLPASLEIPPGQSQEVALHLTFERKGGFGVGRRTVTDHGSLELAGTVSSPWADVLVREFDLPFTPELAGASAPITASGEVGWRLATLLLLCAAVLAAALLIRAAQLARQPRLRGGLIVLDGAGPVTDEMRLGGRIQRFGKGRLAACKGRLSGTVRAVRRRSPLDRQVEYGVRVKATANGVTRKQVMWPGERVSVGDVEISYHE